MLDQRLEERKNKFQSNNVDILATREQKQLNIRKKKNNEMLIRKRLKDLSSVKSDLEINPDDLDIPKEILKENITSLTEHLTYIRELIHSDNLNLVKYGVHLVRRQATLELNNIIVDIYNFGLFHDLVDILDKYQNETSLIYEIIWCFTNLFGGDEDSFAGAFTTPKFLRILESLLSYPENEIQILALWAITNMIGTLESTFKAIHDETDIIEKVISWYSSEKTIPFEQIQQGAWFFAIVTKFKHISFKKLNQITEVITRLIKLKNKDLIGDCVWCLSQITTHSYDSLLEDILNSGCLYYVGYKDNYSTTSLLIPLVRLTGNLLTGNNLIIERVLEYGVLEFLKHVLTVGRAQVRREALWAISNICAGTKSHIELIVQSPLFGLVLDSFLDHNTVVIREALWCVCNALHGSDLQLCLKIHEYKIVKPILLVFERYFEQVEIVCLCLELLNNYFVNGKQLVQFNTNNPFVMEFVNEGGIDMFQKLQEHSDMEVRKLLDSICYEYFGIEEIK